MRKREAHLVKPGDWVIYARQPYQVLAVVPKTAEAPRPPYFVLSIYGVRQAVTYAVCRRNPQRHLIERMQQAKEARA